MAFVIIGDESRSAGLAVATTQECCTVVSRRNDPGTHLPRRRDPRAEHPLLPLARLASKAHAELRTDVERCVKLVASCPAALPSDEHEGRFQWRAMGTEWERPSQHGHDRTGPDGPHRPYQSADCGFELLGAYSRPSARPTEAESTATATTLPCI